MSELLLAAAVISEAADAGALLAARDRMTSADSAAVASRLLVAGRCCWWC